MREKDEKIFLPVNAKWEIFCMIFYDDDDRYSEIIGIRNVVFFGGHGCEYVDVVIKKNLELMLKYGNFV